MIPKAKELKLISMYLYICDLYDSELKHLCQRFSNNNEPEFTEAFSRPGHLPFPESLIVTPDSENNLNIQRQYWSNFYDRTFYGDKIYNDIDFFNKMIRSHNSRMMIPMKAVKGQALMISQIDKAAIYIQPQCQKSDNLLRLYSIGLKKKQIFKEHGRCVLPKD